MAELTRRGLLARAGLATGAAVALRKVERLEAAPDLTDWGAVRAQFALARDHVHLTSFLLAAHPRPVREAIDRHRRRLDANPVEYLHANEGRLTAEVRAAGRPLPRRAVFRGRSYGLDDDGSRTALHAACAAPAGRGLDDGARFLRHARGAPPVGRARPARAPLRRLARRLRRRDRDEAATGRDGKNARRGPDVGALQHGREASAARRSRTRCPTGCSCASTGCTAWEPRPRRPGACAATPSRRAATSGCTARAEPGVLWAGPRVRELVRPTIPSFDDGESYGAWLAGRAPSGVPDGARLTPGGFHSFEHRWALAEAFAFHEGIGRVRVSRRGSARLSPGYGTGSPSVPGVTVRTPGPPLRCPPALSASTSKDETRRTSSPGSPSDESSRASRRTRVATCASVPASSTPSPTSTPPSAPSQPCSAGIHSSTTG